jgi:hypothetical protein
MKYLDTGDRDIAKTLYRWFENLTPTDIASIRIQTGFFSEDSLGLIAPIFEHCKTQDIPTSVLIGSNDGGTLKTSISAIAELIDLSRSNSRLGVVSYSGGYYHPKVYHLSRSDGSQVAFVGSANLTGAGLTQHVEAGVAFDSAEGDPTSILDSISTAVDKWFDEKRKGLIEITSSSDIDQLADEGILAITPPKRSSSGSSAGVSSSGKPRLTPLVKLPKLPKAGTSAISSKTKPSSSTGIGSPKTSGSGHSGGAPRSGFPAYLLFRPKSTTPTNGLAALSGASLPNGAAGLIIKLNKDSARHFAGERGTANISIPVATVSTIRFGIYQGKAGGKSIERPRAEYQLLLRYVGNKADIRIDPEDTNVMAYGFGTHESGHGDIRMVVPAKAGELATLIENAGHTVPSNGDLALLQWPETSDPAFGLIFLDPSSSLYASVEKVYKEAEAGKEIVGKGACWLPPSLIPAW